MFRRGFVIFHLLWSAVALVKATFGLFWPKLFNVSAAGGAFRNGESPAFPRDFLRLLFFRRAVAESRLFLFFSIAACVPRNLVCLCLWHNSNLLLYFFSFYFLSHSSFSQTPVSQKINFSALIF